MNEVTGQLVLVLNDGGFSAWYLIGGKNPQNIPVHDESTFSIASAADIHDALLDIKGNLDIRGLKVSHYHWLASYDVRQQFIDWHLLADWFSGSFDWQLVSLDWLAARFGRQTSELTQPFIVQELLPWLANTDGAAEREHTDEFECLRNERVALEQENHRLQVQNKALHQVDKERLVTYLPAIFHQVFTVLGATDLALLCGSVEPLSIPNPYPEPSNETLRILQKQFFTLPRNVQLDIVELVNKYRHRLKVRREMSELIFELEGGV